MQTQSVLKNVIRKVYGIRERIILVKYLTFLWRIVSNCGLLIYAAVL